MSLAESGKTASAVLRIVFPLLASLFNYRECLIRLIALTAILCYMSLFSSRGAEGHMHSDSKDAELQQRSTSFHHCFRSVLSDFKFHLPASKFIVSAEIIPTVHNSFIRSESPMTPVRQEALRYFQETYELVLKFFTSLFSFKRSKDAVSVDAAFVFLRSLLQIKTDSVTSFLEQSIRLRFASPC